MDLHKVCTGRWIDWIADGTVTQLELSAFLDYAAIFLNNIGNYFVSTSSNFTSASFQIQKLTKFEGRRWKEDRP
ncbi:hypothetical protein N7540_002375 [Penicillium herquei]|nr:hypothetical protein N7540_002375 [Penicillium herquei]